MINMFIQQVYKMKGLSVGGSETDIGQNLQAFTVYIYKNFFIVQANKEMTGITSKIKIDRKTHDILQFGTVCYNSDLQEPNPPNAEKKVVCSALLGILPILNKHFLLIVETCKTVCSIEGKNIYQVMQVALLSFEQEDIMVRDHQGNLTDKSLKLTQQNSKILQCAVYLKTYLLTQGYYFAFKYDLTLSRNAHAAGYPSKKKFLWNLYIVKNIDKLSDRRWLIGLMQGSIKNFKLILDGNTLDYTLITRRSWTKGGTRFNSRGIDNKGNVANFCETQQLIFIGNYCYSHVQIRGSVPLFWKQVNVGNDVQFQMSDKLNEQSFDKHFKKVIRHYNRVFCINLLCKQKTGQIDLSLYYEKLIRERAPKQVKYQYFDLHCACSGQRFERCNYLIDKIHGINDFFSYYKEDLTTKMVVSTQKGVVRVNCLDNLDRTNVIQSKIAYYTLTTILQNLKIDIKKIVNSPSILIGADNVNNESILIVQLKHAWADNGDMISKHYTGTGSTHSNVTRTGNRDLMGLVNHGMKTCKRLYQQYVDDKQKQEVIDILIGEHTETVNLSQVEARLKALSDQQDSDQMTSSLVQNW